MDGLPLTIWGCSPLLSRGISGYEAIPCEGITWRKRPSALIIPVEHPFLCRRERSTPRPDFPHTGGSRGYSLGPIGHNQCDGRSTPKEKPPHISEPQSWTTPPASAILISNAPCYRCPNVRGFPPMEIRAQSPEMADVVLRAVRAGRWPGPGGYRTVLAVEPGCRETEGTGGTGPSRERRHFLDRGTLDPDERRSTTMTQIRSHPVERWTASCCALYKRVRRSFTDG